MSLLSTAATAIGKLTSGPSLREVQERIQQHRTSTTAEIKRLEAEVAEKSEPRLRREREFAAEQRARLTLSNYSDSSQRTAEALAVELSRHPEMQPVHALLKKCDQLQTHYQAASPTMTVQFRAHTGAHVLDNGYCQLANIVKQLVALRDRLRRCLVDPDSDVAAEIEHAREALNALDA